MGCFEDHGGTFLGSEGDSLFVAFAQVSSALAAAIAGQLALGAHAWPRGAPVKARMGVHAGEAQRLGDGYVGMAIHVAARVCAAGHGGQILTTETTQRLSPDFPVTDLGEHELKDIGPTRILQLRHEGLPDAFPPLRAHSALANNLPSGQDRFVGRVRELHAAVEALTTSRLVTLTGPGGTGKTRLALEVARNVLPDFPDGVWFVPLARGSGSQRVVALVAESLGLRESGERDLDAEVEQWLGPRNVLLLLDNCEHVVEEVAALADRLLELSPGLRILTTSRELLGVRAERAMRVPPLSMPDDQGDGRSDAVELLLARAETMVPDFDRDGVDVELAGQLCRRLDGLPLAIELAAARLRAVSMEELANRLDDRFRLLTGGSRTDLPRHRTLQAVVTWSYDLLLEPEQQVFRRVSVFPDDFTLAAAEAVVSGPPVPEGDVLDVLTRLVEKSLLSVAPVGGGYRYRLLETLRQYGQDRLVESGEVAEWRNRLLDWTMQEVADVEQALRTPRQDAALGAAIANRTSHLAAMTWAREQGNDTAALRIISVVPVASAGERRTLIESCLEAVDGANRTEDLSVGRAYAALANVAFEQGDWAYGVEVSRRAFDYFDRAGDRRQAAWSLSMEMNLHWGAGDLQEVDRLQGRITREYHELHDDMGLGYTLWSASMRTRDLDEAEAMAAEADVLLRRTGSRMGIAHNVEGWGIIAFERGDLPTAARRVSEALTLFSGAMSYGCTAHALEAAVVVLSQRRPLVVDEGTLGEILVAADWLRDRSGQGHRPWEVRARNPKVAALLDGLVSQATPDQRPHTLASAATAALEALGRTEPGEVPP
jgi:predicted ATPase